MKINVLLEKSTILEMALDELKSVDSVLRKKLSQDFNIELRMTDHAFRRLIIDSKSDPSRNVDPMNFFRSVIKGLIDSKSYRDAMKQKRQRAKLGFTNINTGLNIVSAIPYDQPPPPPKKLHHMELITVKLKEDFGSDSYPDTKWFKFRV